MCRILPREIEGADNIELIGVLGWCVIAKKGEFKVGDLSVYIEIDSKCNSEDKRFEFLEAKHYNVKTMKLGKFKCFSQGLALPLSLFPELSHNKIGDDVTKELILSVLFYNNALSKNPAFDLDAS